MENGEIPCVECEQKEHQKPTPIDIQVPRVLYSALLENFSPALNCSIVKQNYLFSSSNYNNFYYFKALSKMVALQLRLTSTEGCLLFFSKGAIWLTLQQLVVNLP